MNKKEGASWITTHPPFQLLKGILKYATVHVKPLRPCGPTSPYKASRSDDAERQFI